MTTRVARFKRAASSYRPPLPTACAAVQAGCLFFLSGWIRSHVHAAWPGGPSEASGSVSWRRRVLSDMASAVLTAAVAGPLSQAPNVIAAHQQAEALSVREVCRAIAAKAGARGFFAGLLPRTASLAGSLFVFPFTIETVQPLLERLRS